MYKILLVDDEKVICKGLIHILTKANLPFDVKDECKNGLEAFEKIKTTDYHIVITDINMPIMNGLELIERVSTIKKHIKFIILSGYDDFAYAKKAMKYGVKDYLLKPIIKSELISLLNNLVNEIELEKTQIQTSEKVDIIIDSIKNHELNYILSKTNISIIEIETRLDSIQLKSFFESNYKTVLISICNQTTHERWNSDIQVSVLCQKYAKDMKIIICSFVDINNNVIVMAKEDFNCLDFYLYLEDRIDEKFICSESSYYSNPLFLQKSYSEAVYMNEHRFILNEKIITKKDLLLLGDDSFHFKEDLLKMVQLLGSGRDTELENLYKKIFNKETIIKNKIDYLKELSSNFYEIVIKGMESILPQKFGQENANYSMLSNIWNYKSIEGYILAVSECLAEINKFITLIKCTYEDKNLIDKAVLYIHQNYNKDLNLAVVANHVSLNYSYFSYLFSLTVKMNFMSYLKRTRIDKAKELLLNADLKINEVSEKVGFKNPQHFASSFKKIVGLTPIEYRYNNRNH